MKNENFGNTGLIKSDFPVSVDQEGVLNRVRAAIRAAGGNSAVSLRASVPLSTLNNFIRGTQIRLDAAYRIAVACGVSLDWLMTGRTAESTGTLAPASEKPQISAVVAEPAPAGINQPSGVDIERLEQAIQIVELLGELRGPGAASKIAGAYDILTSRKP